MRDDFFDRSEIGTTEFDRIRRSGSNIHSVELQISNDLIGDQYGTKFANGDVRSRGLVNFTFGFFQNTTFSCPHMLRMPLSV